MGHPGGQQTHRGHLLRVLELLLEADPGGDVLENEDRADDDSDDDVEELDDIEVVELEE